MADFLARLLEAESRDEALSSRGAIGTSKAQEDGATAKVPPALQDAAPPALDPDEVFDTLPLSLQAAFDARDLAALDTALSELGSEERAHHMDRCVRSGLWNPSASREEPPSGSRVSDASAPAFETGGESGGALARKRPKGKPPSGRPPQGPGKGSPGKLIKPGKGSPVKPTLGKGSPVKPTPGKGSPAKAAPGKGSPGSRLSQPKRPVLPTVGPKEGAKAGARNVNRDLVQFGFEVLGPISAGAFSTVLRAKHVESGEEMAIKTFFKGASSSTADESERELGVLRLLAPEGHAHIANMLAEHETPHATHAVLYYCGGGSLLLQLEKLKKKQLAMREEDSALVAAQTLSALQFMHSLGVAHRDVKPGNILFDHQDGSWRLCDFGFSLKCGERILKKAVGTPAYVAPEIVANEGYVGSLVDLWAMGCVSARRTCLLERRALPKALTRSCPTITSSRLLPLPINRSSTRCCTAVLRLSPRMSRRSRCASRMALTLLSCRASGLQHVRSSKHSAHASRVVGLPRRRPSMTSG